MNAPKRYWRFPTGAAIDAIARRFDLPYDPLDEDWDTHGVEPTKLLTMLEALEAGELTDDEQFLLGSKVMATFSDLAEGGTAVANTDEWRRFVAVLRSRPAIHAFTLWFFAFVDSTDPDDATYGVVPLVRPLWAKLEPTIAAG